MKATGNHIGDLDDRLTRIGGMAEILIMVSQLPGNVDVDRGALGELGRVMWEASEGCQRALAELRLERRAA